MKNIRKSRIHKERFGGPADFGKSYPLGNYNGSIQYLYPGDGGSGGQTTNIMRPETVLMDAFTAQPRNQLQYSYYHCGSEVFDASNLQRPAWNECTHVKHANSFSYPYTHFKLGGPQLADEVHCSRHNNWIDMGADFYVFPLLKAEASEFTRARAWATMLPRFESDFKALNFLFELKDFKDIGANIAGLLRGNSPFTHLLRDLGHNSNVKQFVAKRSIPSHKNVTAAQAFDGGANSIAEAWLLNSFAIQPTLKDVAAFSAAIATEYLDALKKFQDTGIKPNTRHYSEPLVDESVLRWSYSNTDESWYLNRVTFTASLEYTYKYNLSDCMRAFAKYWGLTGTAEEFWNMLPFSFLLDYVFQVAKSLRLSEVDKNLDLTVVNYSESTLSETGIYLGMSRYASVPTIGYIIDGKVYNHDGKFRPFMGRHGSSYTRVLTQPHKYGLTLPQWKTPKLNQWYNIGALVKTLLF